MAPAPAPASVCFPSLVPGGLSRRSPPICPPVPQHQKKNGCEASQRMTQPSSRSNLLASAASTAIGHCFFWLAKGRRTIALVVDPLPHQNFLLSPATILCPRTQHRPGAAASWWPAPAIAAHSHLRRSWSHCLQTRDYAHASHALGPSFLHRLSSHLDLTPHTQQSKQQNKAAPTRHPPRGVCAHQTEPGGHRVAFWSVGSSSISSATASREDREQKSRERQTKARPRKVASSTPCS